MTTTRDKLTAAAAVTIYLIRLLQIGTLAIAGYCACYLAWMHRFHYCRWRYCSDNSAMSVPLGEVLFIIAVSEPFSLSLSLSLPPTSYLLKNATGTDSCPSQLVIATLEWILFAADIVLQAHKTTRSRTSEPGVLGGILKNHTQLVDSSTQFMCAAFALFIYSIGFVAYASNPKVHATWPYCYNMWNNDVFNPPETYFCIVTQNSLTCALIGWWVCLFFFFFFSFSFFRAVFGWSCGCGCCWG